MDVHVINLDRSKDRWAAFEKVNGCTHIDFQRFAAIDGRGIARGPLVDRGVITADLGYSDGVLGCALSHLALWDLAIASGQPLTVCEDDAIFNSGFSTASEEAVRALPDDWHIMLWGWNFDSILLFDILPGVSPCLSLLDEARMRMGVGAFQSSRLTPRPFKLFNTFGLVGYAVSPRGALAMKEHCLPIRNMDVYIPGLGRTIANEEFDITLNKSYRDINAYVSFPPLIITRNIHTDSTIREEP